MCQIGYIQKENQQLKLTGNSLSSTTWNKKLDQSIESSFGIFEDFYLQV